LRQLTLATLDCATMRKRLPGYLEAMRIAPSGSLSDEVPETTGYEVKVAWPAWILPQLDQHFLSEQLRSDKLRAADGKWNVPRLDVFQCPSDPQTDATYPALSYVGNTGAPDVTPTDTQGSSDSIANGVFHNLLPGAGGPAFPMWKTSFPDGANSTLLFSENVHRNYPSDGDVGNTLLRPDISAKNVEQWYGMIWVFDPRSPLVPRPELADAFNRDTRQGDAANLPYGPAGTRFARPASNHPGVFVVAFCGGNTRVISESIAYPVYQQLMTPDGAKCVWLQNSSVNLSTATPAFQNIPVPLSDY
jgi:hypothetical protein